MISQHTPEPRRLTLAFVLGTRPEIIKLAPVIIEAQRRGHKTQIVLTGQHGDMVTPLLRFFRLEPDIDLAVMAPNQTLHELSVRVLSRLNGYCGAIAPDYLIVQGDTTTAFCAAYWGFCQKIPIAHIEAGLRTHDLNAPFPEEGNRQLIGRIARFHFAPTREAARALRQEGVPTSQIRTVGNTGIDALLLAVEQLKQPRPPGLDPDEASGQHARIIEFVGAHRLVLVTAHRRESFGAPFEQICQGIREIADARHDVRIVYPVHPNPQVRDLVTLRLGRHPRILLCAPLPYASFVDLMRRSDVLLTDSGGVQEEGPSLHVPILVMRDVTERPEGIRAGFSRLVGTSAPQIFDGVFQALRDGCTAQGPNPYGDGEASGRIVHALEHAPVRPVRAKSTPRVRSASLPCLSGELA